MNPVNQAVRFWGSITAAGVFTPINSAGTVAGIFDFAEVTNWTIWLNASTGAFNGTVNLQIAEIARDSTEATFLAPATIQLNGGTATFTQPAAFTGTQIVLMAMQFPLPPWRLNCTAFTSGALGIQVIGV